MNISYTALTESYKDYLKALGFSDHVLKSHPPMLRYFLQHLEETQGVFQITDLTAKHLNNYFAYLQMRSNMRIKGKALSKSHINKNFDAIDKFLEFLYERGLATVPLPTNYRILETKTEIEGKVKAFKKEEIQTLYESTNKLFPQLAFSEAEPRRALAVLILDLCYGCGLRRSEAYNLLISDIDFDKKLLFIRQSKGNKDRYVPMSETITRRIKEFVYQHRRAFETMDNSVFPLSFHSLVYYFKTLLRHSGLTYDFGTGLHILRHSIATHLLQNGMSIEQIAKFLGHSSLESTQVYTHLIEEYEPAGEE